MKYCIEVEEKVSTIHQILVEVENENELDEALANAERAYDFDSYVNAVKDVIKVLGINKDYQFNDESVEYWDCREAKDIND